jgi:hypothetical protein
MCTTSLTIQQFKFFMLNKNNTLWTNVNKIKISNKKNQIFI